MSTRGQGNSDPKWYATFRHSKKHLFHIWDSYLKNVGDMLGHIYSRNVDKDQGHSDLKIV